MMARLILLLSLFLFTSSCTLEDEGVNLASSVDVDACKESGSENCLTGVRVSALELVVRTNMIQPFASEGDCGGLTNAHDGLSPLPGGGVVDPPTVYPTASNQRVYCADVSGYCNEGDANKAFVILRRASVPIVGNPVVLAECVRGRFHFQLPLNLSSGQVCKRQSFEIELIGKTIEDEEITNPARTKKTFDFLVRNHPSCIN